MGYTPKYLGHVNIFVRNAERSRQWYTDVLGLHTYDFIPGRAAFLSADREQSSTAFSPEVAEEMVKYGITRVPVDYFCYREFRYTNLKDAIAQAKRDQGVG